MSTPGEKPQEPTQPVPGSYGEIAPGVPRYGQYAPAGWEPPQDVKDAQAANTPPSALAPAAAYPGFQGAASGAPAGVAGGPLEHLAAPKQVSLAVRLIKLAGIMQAVSAVALIFVMFVPAGKAIMVEALNTAMADNPAFTEIYADPALINTVVYMAFVLSVALSVVYFWLAAKIRRGANWARTTALVLACFSLLALLQASPVSILQVGLGVVAVIILFRSPAKEFFLAHKAAKSSIKR
ncbi:hypothetical protein AS189_01150 [Arthrobacter alpinus]|uniref:Uncharacterized protein n=1 Tax=Arthrobacter alpinus TaxID=656366 RepID=A0A0S2LVQ8_9MICC|nr:hypothetical protein [Arthrobacter alpinus]ALO65351.1 hypothetical protein AS189_01150 [Arthrobacter alpinus]